MPTNVSTVGPANPAISEADLAQVAAKMLAQTGTTTAKPAFRTLSFADEELFALRPSTGCRLAGRLAGRTVLLKAALAAVKTGRNLGIPKAVSAAHRALGSV
eukprot:s445_g15.t1